MDQLLECDTLYYDNSQCLPHWEDLLEGKLSSVEVISVICSEYVYIMLGYNTCLIIDYIQ